MFTYFKNSYWNSVFFLLMFWPQSSSLVGTGSVADCTLKESWPHLKNRTNAVQINTWNFRFRAVRFMGENSASDLFLQVWSSRYGQSSSQGRQTMTTPLTLLPTGQSSVASERVGKTRAEQSNPLASARSVHLFCVFSRPTSDSVRERPSPRAFRQRCHRGEGVACSRQRWWWWVDA